MGQSSINILCVSRQIPLGSVYVSVWVQYHHHGPGYIDFRDIGHNRYAICQSMEDLLVAPNEDIWGFTYSSLFILLTWLFAIFSVFSVFSVSFLID
jgi:hypothetical protein